MSTDAWLVWMDLSATLPNPSVRAFAVDPTDRQRIVVGTGDYVRFSGAGMFRTLDGGNTWTQISLPVDPEYFFRMLYREDGTYQTILAASSGGILRSTDNGATWSVAQIAGGGGAADGLWTDLRAHPTNDAVFFACRGTGSPNGVYRSTDGGATWSALSTTNLPSGGAWDRATMAVAASDPSVLAVLVENDGALEGVYKSEDGGSSWSEITGDLIRPADDYSFGGGQVIHAQAITFKSDDPDWLLVGAVGLALTTDGGATWQIGQSVHGIERGHADFTQLFFRGNNGLWMANDGGIYFHDVLASKTFHALGNSTTGLACTEMDFLDADRYVRGFGSQDNGSALSIDQGITWEFLGGGDGADIEIYDPDDGDIWYNVGADPWNTYRKRYGQAAEFSDNPPKYMPRIFYRRADDRIYTNDGTDIYSTSASADPIEAWVNEVGNLQSDTYGIRSMSGGNAGDPAFYVTYWTGGSADNHRDLTIVHKSGGSWQINHLEDFNPSVDYVQQVKVSELWPGECWVGMSGPPGSPKLMHTTDYGQTWEDLTANLVDLPAVKTIEVMPFDPLTLFVGTELGVYRSTDGGASWQPFMEGLPVGRSRELRLVADPSHSDQWQLILASDGKGMWSRAVVSPPVIFVDGDATGTEDGTIWHPYNTMAEGLLAAPAGAVVALRRDTYIEPSTVDQDVRLVSWGGGSAVVR